MNALQVLDAGRIGIAALSVGLAQGAFDAARRYAREREQFGQPIASFQATQWKLADMATRIESARLLTYRAAYLKDEGHPTTRESSMAKLFSSEVAVRAAEECVQIHGGYGFVKDYLRRSSFGMSKLMTIGEGTSEIQRLVIARQYLADAVSIESLADGVVSGHPRSIARAISLVEAGSTAGQGLVRSLVPRTGSTQILGVTGAPGVGKSTLVDALTVEWRRADRRVGILAIDPTSPYSGGAILGDRIRMQTHSGDAGVYVRSMATRGHMGGLARATSDAVVVLDAAGCDLVVIETVGGRAGRSGYSQDGRRVGSSDRSRDGRRRTGDESRCHGDRGCLCRQQSRPRRGRPRGGPRSSRF